MKYTKQIFSRKGQIPHSNLKIKALKIKEKEDNKFASIILA